MTHECHQYVSGSGHSHCINRVSQSCYRTASFILQSHLTANNIFFNSIITFVARRTDKTVIMADKIEMSLDEIIKSSKIGKVGFRGGRGGQRNTRGRGGYGGGNQRRPLNGGGIMKGRNRGAPQKQRFSRVRRS